MRICLVDTSVFVELLQVPRMCQRHDQAKASLEQKIRAGEKLFLPMATLFETGNHIAHNGDGGQRRACGARFVKQVRLALREDSPFIPLRFPTKKDVECWLSEFPNSAMRGSGLGDLAIVQDYRHVRSLHPRREVYIWSYDQHLRGYRSV